MDELPDRSDDKNFDRDSLSDGQISSDSLVNDSEKPAPQERTQLRRRGSYTIELAPDKRHLGPFVDIGHSQQSGTSPRRPESGRSPGNGVIPKSMSQSMYERPWVSAKKNSSIASSVNRQREEKIRLAQEEQRKQQLKKAVELGETQKQAEIARRRKEDEIQRKLEEKKRKAHERQRIVEERKQRLAQAEEARKSRILRKMTNQEERAVVPHSSINAMTMSCYGAVESAKRRPGNKEVVKDRFISKRPISSTGKVIGFGSSSPRIICENPMKSISKHPPKISDYLMERSQILSRPMSCRISDKMTTSVMIPHTATTSGSSIGRHGSLREKRVMKPITNLPKMDESINVKIKKPRPVSQIEGSATSPSQQSRISSRKSNLMQSNKLHEPPKKSVRERPSSAKPGQHIMDLPDKSLVQSKSSTFPKVRNIRQSNKGKVDVHLDSDSIEDEGITLTESYNQPRSIASSSVSHIKSEVNRTDLSSGDSLNAENTKNVIAENAESEQQLDVDKQALKTCISGRALPTKDLSEADYKTRLMENRRLIREKREREREQLMKAERERRHTEEATVREIIEMEKTKIVATEDPHFTTSNDDAIEEHLKPTEIINQLKEEKEPDVSISIQKADQTNSNSESKADKENEEKLRLERRKKLESIMSRIKKTAEESSSEGGSVSPRRAMSPEQAELDTEATVAAPNSKFRSTLLQSMLHQGKLSGISKSPVSSKEQDESKLVQENPVGTLTLASLRESMEDSESLQVNMNSKSSAAVRSSGIDGNSLSDANSDFVVDQEDPSHSSVTSNVQLSKSRGDCDGKEESIISPKEDVLTNGVNNANGTVNYSSASSIETEEEEIIKNSFNQDHLYNSHIIRPLAQEGCVFQS